MPARVAARGLLVPAIVGDAGAHAARRFLEFFTATIRNRNTRPAYYHAVARFLQAVVAARFQRTGVTLIAVRRGQSERHRALIGAQDASRAGGEPDASAMQMVAASVIDAELVLAAVNAQAPARDARGVAPSGGADVVNIGEVAVECGEAEYDAAAATIMQGNDEILHNGAERDDGTPCASFRRSRISEISGPSGSVPKR